MINIIKISSIVFVLTIILVASYGCYTPSGTISTSTSETQVQQSSESAAATTTEAQASETGSNVTMENFAFNPSELKVKVGDTVTWTNMDSATHDVKSDLFQSDSLKKGDSFSFTFDTAGTYEYICSFHPSMKGTIIVE